MISLIINYKWTLRPNSGYVFKGPKPFLTPQLYSYHFSNIKFFFSGSYKNDKWKLSNKLRVWEIII